MAAFEMALVFAALGEQRARRGSVAAALLLLLGGRVFAARDGTSVAAGDR
jgi:hypothetical protein